MPSTYEFVRSYVSNTPGARPAVSVRERKKRGGTPIKEIVFDAIKTHGPISYIELTKLTNQHHKTVSSRISDMAKEGRIVRTPAGYVTKENAPSADEANKVYAEYESIMGVLAGESYSHLETIAKTLGMDEGRVERRLDELNKRGLVKHIGFGAYEPKIPNKTSAIADYKPELEDWIFDIITKLDGISGEEIAIRTMKALPVVQEQLAKMREGGLIRIDGSKYRCAID
jgi:Mn-dependent DtxR family transcriptional regulator